MSPAPPEGAGLDLDELLTAVEAEPRLARVVRRHVEVARASRDLVADLRGPSLDEIELLELATDHRDEFLAAVARSADHFAGWGGPPASAEEFDAMLERSRDAGAVRFVALHHGALVGGIGIQNIVRGHGQYATLGYYGFVPHAGRGLMRRAVALAVDHALGEMDLHRLEAGIMPHNLRSLAVVQALGFRFEGLLTRLVQIEDTWQDHELWATDTEDWPGAQWFFPG